MAGYTLFYEIGELKCDWCLQLITQKIYVNILQNTFCSPECKFMYDSEMNLTALNSLMN